MQKSEIRLQFEIVTNLFRKAFDDWFVFRATYPLPYLMPIAVDREYLQEQNICNRKEIEILTKMVLCMDSMGL
jgi:hypothetical protein